jgi:hypothetical protein
MRRIPSIALALAGVVGVLGHQALAAQAPPPVKVCTLLSKAEVKKLVGGWNAVLDQFEPEEEAIGTTGSSCNYPVVMVQVLLYSQGTIDAAKKRGRLETVTGVGDEAYLYDNPAGYAELYVKVGARLLTLQRSLGQGGTMASVRPGVVALANAYVAKLR